MGSILEYQFYVLLGMLVLGMLVIGWRLAKIKSRLDGLEKQERDGNGNPSLVRRVTDCEIALERIEPELKHIEQSAKTSIQKVGFKRYNPFRDTGGDNSFILTLLDRDNTGVIMTSLYTREGMRMYGKNVVAGDSHHQLTDEETAVLEETKNVRNA